MKYKITLAILSSLLTLPLIGARTSDSYTIGAEGLLPQTSFAGGGYVLEGTLAPYGGGSISTDSFTVLAGINPGSNTNIALPKLESQPTDGDLLEGETFTLEVAVSGPGPYSYDWMKDGVSISDASVLEIAGVTNDDEGEYSVTVSNSFGEVNSLTASLSVLAKPVILAQPEDAVGTPGGSVTFTVDARTEGSPVFTWYKDGVAIDGADTSTLLLTGLDLDDLAAYSLEITNEAGTVTSDSASLTDLIGDETLVPGALAGSSVVSINENSVTYMSDWFGEFTVQNDSQFGWVWTDPLGWTFITSISTPEVAYIYPLLVGGIVYTAEGLYPSYGYSYNDNSWLYFDALNDANNGIIWVWNFSAETWVSYSE